MDRIDRQLTHKDRKYIQESLLRIQLDHTETDEMLILNVSQYLKNNPPSNGAERSYHQFAVDLINHLRHHPDDSSSETVRRALKFLQPLSDNSHAHVIPAIKAFVAGFALHEISDHGGLLLADEIQGLSDEEKREAEVMLLDLAGNSEDGDISLLERTRHFVASFGDGESTSIVTRFLRNIRKLTDVLSGGREWSDEEKTWARGALNYVHLSEDVIPDDFGIIGLLDDMYIVSIAVRFIGPGVQALEEVIFDLYAAWPFLRDLVLTYDETEYVYNEFSLINTALACPALTRHVDSERAALILPRSGITPFMVAFGAALGAAYDAVKSANYPVSFKLGQKVHIDSEAVAEYDGLDEVEGIEYIRLKQYSTQKGQKLETIFRIPAEQGGRLCPAPDDAALRGKISTQIDDADISLAGTEALFHLRLPQNFGRISGRVWLVSQVSTVRALSSEIGLYGHPLSAVLPMGHIRKDGDIERWDKRFGTTECILTTIPDLDLAAEILEEKDLTDDDLIVINLSGTNGKKFAALSQIQSLGARVLCITEEKDTDTIGILQDNSYGFWEWSADEVEDILINSEPFTDSVHPFRRNDGSVIRSLALRPDIRVLAIDVAEKAIADLDRFEAYVRRAGEDSPEELRELLDELFSIALELIRLPVPLSRLPGGSGKVIKRLEELSERAQRSLYLDEEEKEHASGAIESLQYFALSLEDENLKTEAIIATAGSSPNAKVLTPPRFPAGTSISPNESEDNGQFIPWQKIREADCNLLLIPFWPGRAKAWDILSDPPSQEICFILYPVEEKWRSVFNRRREWSRTQRARRSRRSAIFNRKYKWNPPPARKTPPVFPEETEETDALIEEQDFRFRQRLVHAAGREGGVADTQARMVVFRGGAHAFFTPWHEAWSATHLISKSSDGAGSEEKLRAVKVSEITDDDVLVFLRGTDRDAIRELADASLPPGTRETAKLWQDALRTYVADKGISIKELKRQLEKAGCRRHVFTLKLWLENEVLIGPRSYASGDLEAIARVTGDEAFREKMGECASAIAKVWGEHMRVSGVIAKRVLSGIEGRIKAGLDLSAPLDIGDGLVLAQVEYVESDDVTVPHSAVNRLKEDI